MKYEILCSKAYEAAILRAKKQTEKPAHRLAKLVQAIKESKQMKK